MIDSENSIFYITRDGKEEVFKLLKEFTNEATKRHFVFYKELSDDATDIFVGEVSKIGANEGEIFEVDENDKENWDFIKEMFEELVSELEAMDLSDYGDEEEDEEDEEDDKKDKDK